MSFRTASLAILIALVGASCTAANPLYTPSADLGDAGTLGEVDFSTNVPGPDLATPGPDLSAPVCTEGKRSCLSVGSAICEASTLVLDRTCPQASTCADGYCQPPPLSPNGVGKSCATAGAANENLCTIGSSGNNPPSCQPFVDDASGSLKVVWHCARAVGAGLPSTPCTDGAQCRSGFCGSNGTCFRACASELDCPSSGQGKRVCEEVEILVEGLAVKAKSCIPG